LRSVSRIVLLGLIVFLAGCASQKQFVPSTPEDAQASEYGNYLSARFAASEHNLKDASEYFRRALKADPTNSQLLALSFFFSTASGDVEGAGQFAAQVVAANSSDHAGRLTLAVIAMKHHDYADARKSLALSSKGPFATLTIGLMDGWAAAGQGDEKTAVADLAALRASGGADTLAMYHLALLADYLGQKDLADESYRSVMMSGASPRTIDAYGRFLERSGRIADATAFYTKFQQQPGLSSVSIAGLARIKTGKKPDALITKPEDGAAEALFGIAASLTDANSADVSILYLRLALYLRPDLDLGAVLLADRFESLEKYEDAIAVYQTVPEASPYFALAIVEIALDKARLGHNDEAIADLKALVASDPNNGEAWTALGDTYRSTSDFAEAAAAYDHAIVLVGSDTSRGWPLLFARAVSEDGNKNWSAAEIDLKQALHMAPNEPQILNYLGYSWVDKNQNIPEALAMLEKARSLKPTDGYIVDSVGWAYFKLGRYSDAAAALQNAVELVPGDPTINEHLGDAFWRVGRKRDAEFQWNHALAFGATGDDKDRVEKKLKDGLSDSAKPN